MDEKLFQELRERLQKANGMRSRIRKCNEEVAHYTRIVDSAQYGSNRHEWAKKKLDYWIAALNEARVKFKEF